MKLPRWLTPPTWFKNWFKRATTLPEDRDSLEEIFGEQIGGFIREMIKDQLAKQVTKLVRAKYTDPETLATKLASDVNAIADPVYKAVDTLADKISPKAGDLLVDIAKTKVFDTLNKMAEDKVGTSDELAAKVYDVIAKAAKL